MQGKKKQEVSQLESNYDGIMILGKERVQRVQRAIITYPGVRCTNPNQGQGTVNN